MNTSQNKYDSIENLIFNEGLKINSVNFSKTLDRMYVHLTNNLVFIVSTELFDSLKNADQQSLNNFQLIADGTGIYWPDLDEDLSLKGFFKDYLKQKVHTDKEFVLA